MASAELTNYVNGLGKMIQQAGVNLEAIRALFQASTTAMFAEKDIDYSLRCTEKAKGLLIELIKKETGYGLWQLENYCIDNKLESEHINLYYEILKQESFYNLQSFIFYMEKKKTSRKRFYYPRIKTLHIVVNDLMDLENGKYKFYGLSLPSRTGKSTTCIFFLAWIMLRRPNSHNAMGGHSGVLAKGFYKEMMNFLTSEDYTFAELYDFWHPDHVLVRDKSAEEFTITLDEPDRFATLTCRGIDGTWTGAIDISKDGYLYVDDLVRNREMSLSPQRMEDCFQTYLNTMVDRKVDGAKELMVGTLWNVTDPLERMRSAYEHDLNYKFRRIPALNDKDESNFDYDINGFSTAYFKEVRERLENAEWMAKYQQRPFVREGLLFPVDELRYFDGFLPDENDAENRKIRIIAALDPAFGGGDSVSMPICVDYGEKERYIVDWVFNRSTQKTTVPLVVKKIMQYGVTELNVEKNNGGTLYIDSIKAEMEKKGCYHCKINPTSAPVKFSKEDKISGYSDFVKDQFIFLLPNKNIKQKAKGQLIRSQEYQNAMDELSMFSPQGKNPHDDAPDSIVQLAMTFERKRNGTITVPTNPFRSMFR